MHRLLLMLLLMTVTASRVGAQVEPLANLPVGDSVVAVVDTMLQAVKADSLLQAIYADSTRKPLYADTIVQEASSMAETVVKELGKPSRQPRQQRDWSTWHPDPQRALWLALVIPGGGQIYNRKYWKLPIVYGGFVGCIYAMMWNNMMYSDYSQAYLDIMDDDPTTASYNKFLHLGRTIDKSNEERYKQIFKSRKDKYRRWRDLSFFTMLGVYVISVIDAYVDAELSDFDISKDLSLKVRPTVIGNSTAAVNYNTNPLQNASLGVNCSLNF